MLTNPAIAESSKVVQIKRVDFPHECDEWDGLFINPEDVEFKYCHCEYFEEDDG